MEIVWRKSLGTSTGRAHTGDVGNSVLVVEDDRGVQELLRRYLEREGLSVTVTASGARAIDALDLGGADVAVVDLGLPDVPGEEVLRTAAGLGTPVIVLSSRDEVQHRIRGLELGADDYVGKPFSPRELVLRVHALLVRRRLLEPSEEESFGGGRLVVRPREHEALLDGAVLRLTPTEWALLVALMGSPRRVFTRSELAGRVDRYGATWHDRAIDSHIKNLRHKLGETASEARIIQTVPGVGYRSGWVRDG
jgi:DNA-binding response OmpR family regulator